MLEYGTDCLEMHVGAVQPGESVLIVDDLVATGGTLSAAIRLLGTFFIFKIASYFYFYPNNKNTFSTCFFFFLERVGAEVVECACVIGLPQVKVIKFIVHYFFYILLFYLNLKLRVNRVIGG